MIATFTANPAIDRTISTSGRVTLGQVHAGTVASEQAAGKGINVARVLAGSGCEVVAVVAFDDPALIAANRRQQPLLNLSSAVVDGPYPVRVNTTITEPSGRTTKFNQAGPELSSEQLAAATSHLLATTRGASWVVLSGALPPGAKPEWYSELAYELRQGGSAVAVDAAGEVLQSTVEKASDSPIDLLKPNAYELAELVGGDGTLFESAARVGNFSDIVEAAQVLIGKGIHTVLVSLGSAGALLATATEVWHATAPKIQLRSTVGAGDSSLAGFLLATMDERSMEQSLVNAVAYGSAAASLPGSTLPGSADVDSAGIHVSRLTADGR